MTDETPDAEATPAPDTAGEVPPSADEAPDADAAPDPAGDEGATAPTPGASRHRGRRVATAVLVVLACVLAPIALLAVWAKTTLLDTDGYVDTVAPLATNQAVIDAGANRITERFMDATDIQERLTEALPTRAQKAAPAMSKAVEQVVHDGALRILESDQFATVWEDANRRAHAQVVNALTGKESGRVQVDNGQVTLDLSAVAKRVRARVQSLGLDVNVTNSRRFNPEIVLFEASWLKSVQSGVDLLDKLAWVLPVVTLLLLAGGIATSVHRRKTVLRAGLGIALGAAIVLIAMNLGRGPYLDLFQKPDGRAAGEAAYDQVLDGLRLGARGIFVLGIVVALGAWLAGPGSAATRLRGTVTGRERQTEPGAFASWVARSKVALRIVIIALGVAALVAFDQLSGLAVLGVAVVVLVGIALVEVIGRAGPATDDGGSEAPGDAAPAPTDAEDATESETV